MKKFMSHCTLMLLSLFYFSAHAAVVKDMVVFGDSLSDSGNLFLATGQPQAPYFQGKFTNGPTYAEHLNEYLGMDVLTPSLAGGLNYAWAAARAGYDTPLGGGQFIPGLATQVNQYMSTLPSNPNLQETLHLVFIGGNDVADALRQGFDTATASIFLQNGAQAVVDSLLALNAVSDTHFLLPSVPDLSRTPRFFLNVQAQTFTTIYNDFLAQALASTSLDYLLFDTSEFIQEISDQFNVTNMPCLTVNGLCGNPEEYLFFDDFHPSANAHQLFAQELLTTIDTPETVWLMMLSVLMFIAYQIQIRTYYSRRRFALLRA